MWVKIRVGTQSVLTGHPLIHTGAYLRFGDQTSEV
jgi:hypothetical protein